MTDEKRPPYLCKNIIEIDGTWSNQTRLSDLRQEHYDLLTEQMPEVDAVSFDRIWRQNKELRARLVACQMEYEQEQDRRREATNLYTQMISSEDEAIRRADDLADKLLNAVKLVEVQEKVIKRLTKELEAAKKACKKKKAVKKK